MNARRPQALPKVDKQFSEEDKVELSYNFSQLKKPGLPAFLFKVGDKRTKKQANGETVEFKVTKLKTLYKNVPSKLDGYPSDWWTLEKVWAPVDIAPYGIEKF